MSNLNSLDREALVQIIETIEAMANEAIGIDGYVDPMHSEGCHTRYAGCLAEAILDVSEDKLMQQAKARVAAVLGSDGGHSL